MSTPAGDGSLVGNATIRFDGDTDPAARALARFSRDARGRLRDVRGRFVSASAAARQMGDDIDGSSRRGRSALGGLSRAVRSLGGFAASAASQIGTSAGGLGGAMGGVAAVAAASLAPALGALVPLSAGAATAAGTLQLAFSGVGDAVALAGEDQEKYREALKEMGPEQRNFTKSLVELKGQFGPIGREIQKAALPGFTKLVKAASPLVDTLGRSMTQMADGFGQAAEGASRLIKTSGFQENFAKVLKLGNVAVGDLTTGLGKLSVSVLDFGAASEPTLRALSGGVRDLLGQALPGMFEGLKRGIEGSAKFLDGLFNGVNRILPAFGRLVGEVAAATGPVFGELFKILGGAGAGALDGLAIRIRAAKPLFDDLVFGLKAVRDIAATIAPTLKDMATGIAGAFLPIGQEAGKAQGPLQRLNDWVKNNRVAILETARAFSNAMIDIAAAVINGIPLVIKGFASMARLVLLAVDGIVSGAAKAFGWIPGIGDKLKGANKAFDTFRNDFIGGLDAAGKQAQRFADSAVPKLEQNKLKLNISNWTQQIAEAKKNLKSVPPEKRAKLQATIDDLQRKARQAKAELAAIRDKTVTVTARYVTYKGKTIFEGSAGRLAKGGLVGYAAGGAVQGFPHGGTVRGPGTSTSDSIPALLSRGEYVVRAAAVRKYGAGLFESLNSMRTSSFAGGGSVGGMGRDLVRGLVDGMSASIGAVSKQARAVADAALVAVRKTLGISSPSRVFATIGRQTGQGFIKGLTGTREKISATAKTIIGSIVKAFRGTRSRVDDRLVALVQRGNARLQVLARQRDSIAQRIADAQKFATDLAASARASGGLASIVQPDFFAPSFVEKEMRKSLNQIKRFTADVAKLQKKGLSKGLLRQILEMGPEAGAQFAASLAGADKATIKRFNSLNSQIGSASSKLGKTGSDLLYDSGKKAGQGFLTGLKAQQKNIEKLMLSIAKGMQKAIRRALGIKSPSQVMAGLGRMSVLGLEGGIARAVPRIDAAMARVAGAMTSGVPSLAGGVPAVTGLSAMRTAGGARTTVIHQHLHFTNHGVMGSRMEVLNWLTRAMDDLNRTGRLPKAA